MKYYDEYKRWINSDIMDTKSKDELLSIKNDEDEIKSRFISLLTFGTAGLRGIMGAGTNMMNIYTIKHATFSLAKVLIKENNKTKENGIVIAYDSRNNSSLFAKTAALVLCNMGIKVYLFNKLTPTPELSFAIRHLKAVSGINITASHNSKEYNGYKVYYDDGAQINVTLANKVKYEMENIDVLSNIEIMEEEYAIKSGLLTYIGEEIDDLYVRQVLNEMETDKYTKKYANEYKIVYTPFHGCGHKLVPLVLKKLSLKNIILVESQMTLDGNFPTVKSPNPENKEGFNEAIKVAKKENAHLIIGTDPDSDRLAVMIRNKDNEYDTITGNQIGALLLDYIIKMEKEKGTFNKDSYTIKSIVTTNIIKSICKKNSIRLEQVLTGFRFVGQKIRQMEESSPNTKFLFAYEESYGFLKGTYARDKDGIVTSMLMAEMACYYYDKGMDLFDALENLYKKYGYYEESFDSIFMTGLTGKAKIDLVSKRIRQTTIKSFNNKKVVKIMDLKKGYELNLLTNEKTQMPYDKLDVIRFTLEDETEIIYRPSGTEPKVKIYVLALNSCAKDCSTSKSDIYLNEMKKLIDDLSKDEHPF